MVNIDSFRSMALSFLGALEVPHFDKAAFRTKKRIFATLDVARHTACLKLTPVQQSVFSLVDPTIIYPVDNKWGQQGWTIIELKKIKKNLLKDALSKAYEASLPGDKK
ncbi:MAG: MmcQ/YjbR family DNA-binding protein [Ferruginibacter sp.]